MPIKVLIPSAKCPDGQWEIAVPGKKKKRGKKKRSRG